MEDENGTQLIVEVEKLSTTEYKCIDVTYPYTQLSLGSGKSIVSEIVQLSYKAPVEVFDLTPVKASFAPNDTVFTLKG